VLLAHALFIGTVGTGHPGKATARTDTSVHITDGTGLADKDREKKSPGPMN